MVNVISSAESQSSDLQLQNVVVEAQQKKNAASQLALRNFYSCELSPDQERVVEELWQFFSSEQQVFLLKGYAGTGKTFLLGGIVRYLAALEWSYCCSAPTGKAAQVLRDKIGEGAATIHSTIYQFAVTSNWAHHDAKVGALDREDENDTLVIGSIKDCLDSCLVMLVDESSMISDEVTDDDDYICGSGKLLRDIFTFLQLEKHPGRKVIFVGDAAQLPPVGSKISPALSAQYLKKHFGYAVVEDELRSIVRQQAQSAILQNSLKLRQSLKNNFYQELTFTLKPGEVETATSHESLVQDLAHRYKAELAQQCMPQVSMVCHTNQLALEYNLHIRHYLFNLPYYATNSGLQGVYAGSYDRMQVVEHPLDLQCCDLLLVLRNNCLHDLYNGQLVLLGQFDPTALITRTIHLRQSKAEQRKLGLKESDSNWIEVTLKFLPVELWCSATNNQWIIKKVLLLTNALYSPERSISRDEQRALYVDFIKRHSDLKRGSKEFIRTLINDPYYNAVQVHFGYALTCHKAQGSEWQHVFVDCNGLTGANEQNFRWLYTAITRAKSKLTLINYRERKVASKLKIASTFKLDESTLPSPQPSTVATPQAPSLNILREPDGAQSEPSLGAQSEPDWNQRASNIVSRINSSLAEQHEPTWDQSVPPFAQSHGANWDQSVPPFALTREQSWEPPVPPYAEPSEPNWEPPAPPYVEPSEPNWEPPVPPYAEPPEQSWEPPVPPYAEPQEPIWDQSAPPYAESHGAHWEQPASPYAESRGSYWEQSTPPYAESHGPHWEQPALPYAESRGPHWEQSVENLNTQPDSSFHQADVAAAPINRGEEEVPPQRNVGSVSIAQSASASSPAEQLVSFCAEQCRQQAYAHLQVSHLASPDYQEQLSISDTREGKSMVLQVYYGGNDCYSKVLVSKSNLDQQLSSKLVDALNAALKGRSRFNLTGENTSSIAAVEPPDMGNVGFNDYLRRLQAYLAQNKILTLSWQKLQYVLRVKFYAAADIAPNIHSGDSVELDIGYNGRYEITNIKPAHKGEGDKPLGHLLLSIIQSF